MSPLGIGEVPWEVSLGYQVAEEKDEHSLVHTSSACDHRPYYLGSELERELHGLLYLQNLGEFLLLINICGVNNNK